MTQTVYSGISTNQEITYADDMERATLADLFGTVMAVIEVLSKANACADLVSDNMREVTFPTLYRFQTLQLVYVMLNSHIFRSTSTIRNWCRPPSLSLSWSLLKG